METKWLTVVEAAQYLKTGRSTVDKLAQEGTLPTHKVGRQGRFDAKELDKWLMASLIYGAGLRLMECLRLRVQDIDFLRNEIIVRDGKGAKDRITMLPEPLKEPLQKHLKKVKAIHARDLPDGRGRVLLPAALDRKYPNASKEWRWQWVFPQESRWKNTRTGEEGRHHVHESIIQKAVNGAVRKAGQAKRATCHTFRHYFATQLLESGNDIRTVQEFLGHKDVKTTMIYTHVLNQGGKGVKSSVDDVERRNEGVLYRRHISPRDCRGTQYNALQIQALC